MKLNLESSLLQAPVSGAAPSTLRLSGNLRSGGSDVGGDSVRVSGISSVLYGYATERSARIDALSRAVADGSYRSSANDIGKAILRHAGG